MSILPSRNNFNQSASTVLVDLKKGDKSTRDEFIWTNQDRVYAIAYIATGEPSLATEMTITSFQNAFAALKHMNAKTISMPIWDWLAQFVVDACETFHRTEHNAPNTSGPNTDPTADGSAQMDWETTIILGGQRVKQSLSSLPKEQRDVLLLRHNFQLNYDQIAAILNQTPENVEAWLFRARVQMVKRLGRG